MFGPSFNSLTILSFCGLMVHVLICRTLIWYWMRDEIIRIVTFWHGTHLWRNVQRRIPWISDSAFGRLTKNRIWFHYYLVLKGFFFQCTYLKRGLGLGPDGSTFKILNSDIRSKQKLTILEINSFAEAIVTLTALPPTPDARSLDVCVVLVFCLSLNRQHLSI